MVCAKTNGIGIKPPRLVAIAPNRLESLPCPLQYYRDLWLIRTSEAAYRREVRDQRSAEGYRQTQRQAALRVWEFHCRWSLPSPTLAMPWRQSGGILEIPGGHLHKLTFHSVGHGSADEKSSVEQFFQELGLDPLYVDGRDGGTSSECRLTWDGPHHSGWKVARSFGRSFRFCCEPGNRPMKVPAWQPMQLEEQLKLRKHLIDWGHDVISRGDVPPLAELASVDQGLISDPVSGPLHAAILEPPARVAAVLWGQAAGVLPVRPQIPDIPLMAWRLAWIDRLTVLRGKDCLLGPSGHQPLDVTDFLKIFRAALFAWPSLMIRCLALAEYLCATMYAGGLSLAAQFEPSHPKSSPVPIASKSPPR